LNGRLRDENLHVHLFLSLANAQVIIEAWLVDYNQRRFHTSLAHVSIKDDRTIAELTE
jgi:putative transposase